MSSKTKPQKPPLQEFPAGVNLNDHNIEFIGNKQDLTVLWMQRGHVLPFNCLPDKIFNELKTLYLSDRRAIEIITELFPHQASEISRAVEIYTCYLFGQLDNKPDVVDGKLQPCENFRTSRACPSLNFKHKYIDVDGVVLNDRDLQILDQIAAGDPDKAIAASLGIAPATLDHHKTSLFKKLNAHSRSEAITKGYLNSAICQ